MSDVQHALSDPEVQTRLAKFRALQKDFSGIDPVTALDGDPEAQELVESLIAFVSDDDRELPAS